MLALTQLLRPHVATQGELYIHITLKCCSLGLARIFYTKQVCTEEELAQTEEEQLGRGKAFEILMLVEQKS